MNAAGSQTVAISSPYFPPSLEVLADWQAATQPIKSNREVRFPECVVDVAQSEVVYGDGQRMELSGREMSLFLYLVDNPSRIITRQELLMNVWQMNSHLIVTRTVDMHIAKLRDKLRDDAHHPKILITVRGEGYLFLLPVQKQANHEVLPTERTVPELVLCS